MKSGSRVKKIQAAVKTALGMGYGVQCAYREMKAGRDDELAVPKPVPSIRIGTMRQRGFSNRMNRRLNGLTDI
jgi:hypothetical protein